VEESTSSQRSARDRARLVATGAVAVLAILFAVVNLDDVEVNWIIGTWKTPLILVIAASVAAGWLLGSIAARRGRRR
jgi:uncharacterized integral membrane protein